MASLDDILVITINMRVPSPDRFIFRVLTREKACAMYPAYISLKTGDIVMGITPDRFYTIHSAAGLGFGHDLAHSLLSIHAELLNYEKNFTWDTEGYADFVARFKHLALIAVDHLPLIVR